MLKTFIAILSGAVLVSCASIVNDPTVPVTLSFSDGSSGNCKLTNKRAAYNVEVPGTNLIRRSDDPLRYDCETTLGKKGYGSIPSEIEGEKLAGSVLIDFGITDSITDKHRTYTPNFVVPVK
ncbi:hypothetical protein [Candidatus Pelagibacter sp. Uisw_106]|uniref:hypothetical protein n=1 Tax=Candidatus Pelagibacter sp. Uisw_106 TaxID=3230984 RepID=UPI0039ED6263